MAVRRFRTSWRLTLAVAAAAACLVALGTWQMQRMLWKTALIEAIDTGLAAPPTPLPADPEPAAFEWHKVGVEGTLRLDEAAAFGFEGHDGQGGAELIAPLVRPEGVPVLVDLGWIPEPVDAYLAAHREPVQTSVEGYVRLDHFDAKPWLRPENDGAGRRWYWKDTDALAHVMQTPDLAPFTLVRTIDTEPGPPVAARAEIELPNRHLGYVITWYGLCLALIGVYVAYGFSNQEASTA